MARQEVRADGSLRVLAFAIAITAVTGLPFGIIPALRARRPDVNDALKIGGWGLSTGRRRRAQPALVVARIALTVVLPTSAGLSLRSLANTMSAPRAGSRLWRATRVNPIVALRND